MKNIFLTGTAGSGKSNLTGILSNWYQQESKNVITVKRLKYLKEVFHFKMMVL